MIHVLPDERRTAACTMCGRTEDHLQVFLLRRHADPGAITFTVCQWCAEELHRAILAHCPTPYDVHMHRYPAC